MTIVVTLSPEMEARVRQSAAQHDLETVRRLLVEAITPSIDATASSLLRNGAADQNGTMVEDGFEALLNHLADMPPRLPSLSDESVSREGIYHDHP